MPSGNFNLRVRFCVALCVLSGGAFFLLRNPRPPALTGEPPLADARVGAGATADGRLLEKPPGVAAFPNVSHPAASSAPSRPPEFALSRGRLGWEIQLDAVAKSAVDSRALARAIFELIPQLPDEALETAAERALERLADLDFSTVALPTLLNASTHGRVLSVLFADLMERPAPVSLPALLLIAQNRDHVFAPYALDNMRLLLQQDFGTDWAKWAGAVRAQAGADGAPVPRATP